MEVVIEKSTYELVEKKSRFIASILYASNVDEINRELLSVRKEHYDAKHNCYAYVLGINGDNVKASDDGEPQGTAGHPMLDILKGKTLTNCLAIVTRYFGGILLGTGGLVRCYSDSLKGAIENAKFSKIRTGYEVHFDINYEDFGKIENIISNINGQDTYDKNLFSIISLDKSFEDKVKLKYLIDEKDFDKFKSNIINITKGNIVLVKDNKKVFFVKNDGINIIG